MGKIIRFRLKLKRVKVNTSRIAVNCQCWSSWRKLKIWNWVRKLIKRKHMQGELIKKSSTFTNGYFCWEVLKPIWRNRRISLLLQLDCCKKASLTWSFSALSHCRVCYTIMYRALFRKIRSRPLNIAQKGEYPFLADFTK